MIDPIVQSLPLEQFGFTHTTNETTGRSPYHPSVLLKLYMYGYRHGIRSSNKLHQACLINVEAWWLLKGLQTGNGASLKSFGSVSPWDIFPRVNHFTQEL